MGHHTCCNKQKVRKGLWSPEEDEKLIRYISTHGHGCWSTVPKVAGLQRCGKSCRLRWVNYLRPDLKRGGFSIQEESLIIELHRILGNRWSKIARHLPGRTDNEVKNFWNSTIKKKLIAINSFRLPNSQNPSSFPIESLVQIHQHEYQVATNQTYFYDAPGAGGVCLQSYSLDRTVTSLDPLQNYQQILSYPQATHGMIPHDQLPCAYGSSKEPYLMQSEVTSQANHATVFTRPSSLSPPSVDLMPSSGFIMNPNLILKQ